MKHNAKELWGFAKENTFLETHIRSMDDVLREFGTDIEYTSNIFVLTNHYQYRGASAILNTKALSEIAKKWNCKKVIIIPSSVHEMIVVPYDKNTDINYFSEMVKEVKELKENLPKSVIQVLKKVFEENYKPEVPLKSMGLHIL